jgi:hypothetical protein
MWMEVGRVTADVQKLMVKDLTEGNEYFIRIFAKNEIGFSDPLENEEPFRVVRPPGRNSSSTICTIYRISRISTLYHLIDATRNSKKF